MHIDDILAAKKPVEASVTIWLDPTVGQRIADLEQRIANLNAAGVFAGKVLEATKAQLAEAQAEGANHAAVFRFHAIGDDRYRALLDEYPPSDDQRAAFRKLQLDRGIPRRELVELRYDDDAFPPVLVAAACVEPQMTVDQARALWSSDRFNEAELYQLFLVAEAVNTRAPNGSLPEG